MFLTAFCGAVNVIDESIRFMISYDKTERGSTFHSILAVNSYDAIITHNRFVIILHAVRYKGLSSMCSVDIAKIEGDLLRRMKLRTPSVFSVVGGYLFLSF